LFACNKLIATCNKPLFADITASAACNNPFLTCNKQIKAAVMLLQADADVLQL
jgi:hypothetical protein